MNKQFARKSGKSIFEQCGTQSYMHACLCKVHGSSRNAGYRQGNIHISTHPSNYLVFLLTTEAGLTGLINPSETEMHNFLTPRDSSSNTSSVPSTYVNRAHSRIFDSVRQSFTAAFYSSLMSNNPLCLSSSASTKSKQSGATKSLENSLNNDY